MEEIICIELQDKKQTMITPARSITLGNIGTW
jgi:hypothetical protein